MASCVPKQSEPATGEKESSPAFDKAWAKTFLDSMNNDYSARFKANDSVGLASFYWPDAELLFDNSEPIRGDGILKTFGEMTHMGIQDFTFVTTDIVGDSEFIIETGGYKMTDARQAIMDRGKYLVVWENRNGVWKIYRDVGSTSMPAPK